MTLKEAEKILSGLVGRDLQKIAVDLNIKTIGPKGGLQKGWAGDVVEKYITKKNVSNSPKPDFEDAELKIVPLKISASGKLSVKEPMSICMANESEILQNPFVDSHVYEKLKSLLLAFYVASDMRKNPVIFVGTKRFYLKDSLLSTAKKDYDLLRSFVKKNGLNSVSGTLGKPCLFFSMRPKDQKGKSSGNMFPRRAFTIRNKDVWNKMLGFSDKEQSAILDNLSKSFTHSFN